MTHHYAKFPADNPFLTEASAGPLDSPVSPDYTFIGHKLKTFLEESNCHIALADDKKEDEEENYFFSPAEIRRLIAEKQKKRPIDAHVVTGNFIGFINKLQKERRANPELLPRRVQVAYKRTDIDEADNQEYAHWTALDILVTQTQLKVFYFDSAGDAHNLTLLKHAVMIHPDAEITICDDVLLNGKYYAVQKDAESCSIFTIDNVFHMSKIPDLHGLVDAYRTKEPDEDRVYGMDPFSLPAVLVRNAQSCGFLKKWKAANPSRLNEIATKSGFNLTEYTNKHIVFFPPLGKEVNTGIQYKRCRYKARLKS